MASSSSPHLLLAMASVMSDPFSSHSPAFFMALAGSDSRLTTARNGVQPAITTHRSRMHACIKYSTHKAVVSGILRFCSRGVSLDKHHLSFSPTLAFSHSPSFSLFILSLISHPAACGVHHSHRSGDCAAQREGRGLVRHALLSCRHWVDRDSRWCAGHHVRGQRGGRPCPCRPPSSEWQGSNHLVCFAALAAPRLLSKKDVYEA